MDKSKYVLVAIIILALVIIGVALTKDKEMEEHLVIDKEEDVVPAITINAKHLYEDGMHYYHGVVTTPSPCYDLRAEVVSPETPGTLDNPNPHKITLTTTEQADVICAQVLTDKEFDVSFEGSVDAPVAVTLDGKKVLLNIIEVDNKDGLKGAFDFKS